MVMRFFWTNSVAPLWLCSGWVGDQELTKGTRYSGLSGQVLPCCERLGNY